MSLKAIMYKTSGLARCKLCGEPIQKNQPSILISGYQSKGQVHSLPKDCKCDRTKTE